MRNKARMSSLITAISQLIQQDKKINNIHNDKKKMELINNHNKAPEEKFNIKRKIAFLYNSNE